jgi:DNA invertase Pin-like site-specific DNA recombinase
MKHGAAYIRVSDERQDEFSPDSQLKLIREYCKSNQIFLDDSMIFYDDGISAKNAEGRREFQKMIDIAKSTTHPIDLIVVWKFSRFARNQEESIIYKSMLKRLNIEVVSVSEPLRGDPFGSLVERIIEWMDEYYLVRLSGEVKRGMKEKALRGQPNAAPPFGMRNRFRLFRRRQSRAVLLFQTSGQRAFSSVRRFFRPLNFVAPIKQLEILFALKFARPDETPARSTRVDADDVSGAPANGAARKTRRVRFRRRFQRAVVTFAAKPPVRLGRIEERARPLFFGRRRNLPPSVAGDVRKRRRNRRDR